MRLPRLLALAVVVSLAAGACGAEPPVTARRADRIAPSADDPVFEPTVPGATVPGATGTGPGTSGPDTGGAPETPPADTAAPADSGVADPPTTDPPVTVPGTTDPGTTEAPAPISVDPEGIDFGIAKPPQPYDDFLLAAIADVEAWWAERFPDVYGGEFTPLDGRIIAAYPGRPDDIPGCGAPRTTYDEVREYAAFYCGEGDFMVYDDGDGGLLANLADRFGPAAIAIVLAHEYGHAIQLRIGALDEPLPTITTEQQADCFAGAWSARVAGGGSPLVRFTDDDIRAGLISMLEVRDPVGVGQFEAGGHGSGFDRVAAFQEGFIDGVARCAELLDDPLPLSPGSYLTDDDRLRGGNAPWGYDDQQLFAMLPSDLNLYWQFDSSETTDTFEPLTLVPVQTAADADCEQLGALFEHGAALCLDGAGPGGVVYVNEPAAFELYRQELFGDFSVGYLLGIAWAEAVQRSSGSTTTGEARELVNDCLAGAWVVTDIPVGILLPEPRHVDRTMQISPGDLDETVRTMILVGDAVSDENVLGTPFEKVEAFRRGLLGGVAACRSGG